MKRNQKLFGLLILMLAIVFSSCSKDDDPVQINISQADLDAVSVLIGNYTGGQMAHGGPDGISADSTMRVVHASSDLKGSLPIGTIVAKNTFHRGIDGNASDQLYVSFAMVKREAGYYTEGGDWEYIMMPNDGSTDYTTHPNGMLPVADTDRRGKLSSCASCHSGAGGGDYLFVN